MFIDFFNTLKGNLVIIELKNNVVIKGKLQFVDNSFNIKLVDLKILNQNDFPQLPIVNSAIIRGSSIRYIHLPDEFVDKEKLHEKTFVEAEIFREKVLEQAVNSKETQKRK